MQYDAQVFIWLEGQKDNVGDSLLRRRYATALQPYGTLSVLVGRVGKDYVNNLGLRPEDNVIERPFRWIRELSKTVRSGTRTVLALNAGAFGMSKSFTLVALLLWLKLKGLKKRGLLVLWYGAAIAPASGWRKTLTHKLINSVDYGRWRDAESPKHTGILATMPDWAFGLHGAGLNSIFSQRKYLTVTLRDDQPHPSPLWFEKIKALAERHGLLIVTLAQVARDQPKAEIIAKGLDASTFEWPGDSHLDIEEQARSIYAQSAITISDRLHALVLAACEGSIPISIMDAPRPKIMDHFSIVGAPWVATGNTIQHATVDGLILDESGELLDSLKTKLHTILIESDLELQRVELEIRNAILTGGN